MSSIQEVFRLCQKSSRHEPFIVMLKKLYSNTAHKAFTREYSRLLSIPLSAKGSESAINRLILLTVKFSTQLNKDYLNGFDEDDENVSMHPFMSDLLRFLLKIVKSRIYTIRLRVLKLISRILHEMIELPCDENLMDEFYNMASLCLKDTSSSVRAEAVFAISYFQDIQAASCPIIGNLLMLMEHDPSFLTRRNVAQVIAVTSQTKDAIKMRLRDVNAHVRKAALVRISAKISIGCFTMSERVEIIELCLNDSILLPIMKEKLLPNWLKCCEDDIVAFLGMFDLYESSKVIKQALTTLFELEDLRILVQKLDLDPQLHLLPKDRLNDETVFFWLCLCQYIKTQNTELALNIIDELMPTISDFCNFLESYVEDITEERNNNKADDSCILKHTFIFEQLLILVGELDNSDIYGLNKLNTLVLDTLKSPICLIEIIEPLVACMHGIQNNKKEFLKRIANISFEFAEPFMKAREEEDYMLPLLKSLKVTSSALKVSNTTDLPQRLCELKDDLLVPCLQHARSNVRHFAIEAIGFYCLLDVHVARDNYCLFVQAMDSESQEMQIVALSTAFDILLRFGPTLISSVTLETEEQTETVQEESLFLLFHAKLVPFLDSEVDALYTIAALGVGKLMLSGYITSANLLSRLLLMCYDMTYDDNLEIRYFLTCFLPSYAASENLKAEVLRDTFIISLNAIFKARRSSSLSQIDSFTVGVALLQLSSLIKSCTSTNGNTAHDLIAAAILKMILEKPATSSCLILSRMMNHLDVTGANTNELLPLIKEALNEISDKTTLRNISKFFLRIKPSDWPADISTFDIPNNYTKTTFSSSVHSSVMNSQASNIRETVIDTNEDSLDDFVVPESPLSKEISETDSSDCVKTS